MPKPLAYIGQAIVYGLIAAGIGFFSTQPEYRQMPEGYAQIKLAFNHGAARVEDCRRLTPDEIAKLPPRERRPNTCSRERVPLRVQLALDGSIIYDAQLQPTGLSRDGPAQAYEKFIVPAGKHVLEARMRDTKRDDGFDKETVVELDLAPMQNLAVDYKAEQGGFLFR